MQLLMLQYFEYHAWGLVVVVKTDNGLEYKKGWP